MRKIRFFLKWVVVCLTIKYHLKHIVSASPNIPSCSFTSMPTSSAEIRGVLPPIMIMALMSISMGAFLHGDCGIAANLSVMSGSLFVCGCYLSICVTHFVRIIFVICVPIMIGLYCITAYFAFNAGHMCNVFGGISIVVIILYASICVTIVKYVTPMLQRALVRSPPSVAGVLV